MDQYARGQHEAVAVALRGHPDLTVLLKDLRRGDGSLLRELGVDRPVAAAFALEAAYAGLYTQWDAARGLLDWATGVVQEHPAFPGERHWHRAAVALAFAMDSGFRTQGQAEVIRDQLRLARRRFPDDPRFLLTNALLEERETWPEPLDPRSRWRRPLDGAADALSRVLDVPSLEAEAHVRLGHLLLRRGDAAGALRHFEASQPTTDDNGLAYLLHLFRGQALATLGQTGNAEKAFRMALASSPGQAAYLELARLPFVDGRRIEASALVQQALAIAARPTDPWRTFGQADLRLVPAYLDRLRGELR